MFPKFLVNELPGWVGNERFWKAAIDPVTYTAGAKWVVCLCTET